VHPVLPVFELPEFGVVAPGPLEDLTARKCTEADRVAVQELERVVRWKAELALPVAEEAHPPVREAEVRFGLERGAQRRERAQSDPVVRIENEDVGGRDACDACVARAGNTQVLLAHDIDLGRELGQRLGRAVVDNDHPRSFAESALDGLRQEAPVVEAGDDDRDVRFHPASIGPGGDDTIQPLSTTPTAAQETKSRVRKFWEDEPCGSVHGSAPEGTKEYFDEIEQRRYELEPFIASMADFAASRGKSVLEIGVGLGTDFVQFARAGAKVTGIDLTEHGVELVRRRLALEGLEGDVRVADAESLPFEDESFDKVYSWGVLHHTPATEQSVREAMRVLRPGGDLCVMLYSRHSWVAYKLWVRFALLEGRLGRSLADVLAAHMESEGTRGFTKDELREMFAGLENLRIEKIPTPYDRRWLGPIAGLTGHWLGWFSVIRGQKPR